MDRGGVGEQWSFFVRSFFFEQVKWVLFVKSFYEKLLTRKEAYSSI